MIVIKIKDIWNSKDSTLVINDRVTETGVTNLWRAVDVTFKYNVVWHEVYLAKKLIQSQAVEDQSQNIMTETVQESGASMQLPKECQDPMQDFFRQNHTSCGNHYHEQNRYVEHQMGA